jgi:hypothetical protein
MRSRSQVKIPSNTATGRQPFVADGAGDGKIRTVTRWLANCDRSIPSTCLGPSTTWRFRCDPGLLIPLPKDNRQWR